MDKNNENNLRGGMVNNFAGATIHNLIINENNETVNVTVNSDTEAPIIHTKTDELHTPDMQTVAEALKRCKPFMWGHAAMATVFGVCRDEYNIADNMSLFEQQLQELKLDCPTGTIANAMKNNPYLKLPLSKWQANGAKERVMALVEEFKKSMDEVISEEQKDTPPT